MQHPTVLGFYAFYWSLGCCEEKLQIQGELVRLTPVSTDLTDMDGRKKAATNQYMNQARRLSVAAGCGPYNWAELECLQ